MRTKYTISTVLTPYKSAKDVCVYSILSSDMGWFRLVGLLKLLVSFAKETYNRVLTPYTSAERQPAAVVVVDLRHTQNSDHFCTFFLGGLFTYSDTHFSYITHAAIT